MCLGDYRDLAHVLKTSPMFTDVLPLLLKPDEAELLLWIKKEGTVDGLARALDLPRSIIETRIKALWLRGFLKREGEDHYSLKSFRSIVSTHLSEGRTGVLGKYVAVLADYRLKEHVEQAEADPHPEAKVLPMPESVMDPVSVVLPYETALGILENTRSISVRNCECRVTYKNCYGPLRTCLGLNEFSDELVERGVSQKVSLGEAKEILRLANQHGLVHQALYTDWLRGEVFDVCSCCSCCCTYLRTYINYGVKHHIAGSGLVANVDSEVCSGCGICLTRCVFKARRIENGKSIVEESDCLGCGLCTTACPTRASTLMSVDKRGKPHQD